MAGLRAAQALGYTHALQIDADGQHDASDIPRFLAAMHDTPDTLILGRPVYDDSVPKARLYGRYVTHVWVWIETLSLDIRDSMCGFRLYPLAPVCALIDAVRIGPRMDFDIEVLVRLHWRGLRVRTIPTRVIYSGDGVSHFHVWRDNARISAMHARLVMEMIPRAPVLIARKLRGRSDKTRSKSMSWWSAPERGSALGIAVLAWCCRVLGVRFAGLLLHPVVAYFVLTSSAARRASARYFTHLADASPSADTPHPGWASAYRHVLSFARSGLDKLAGWSGQMPLNAIEIEDREVYDEIVTSGKGALVLGSHLGNLEMTRALAARDARSRVTAVVHTEHAQRFNAMLAHASSEFRERMLEIGSVGPDTAIALKSRIDAGEILVIVGDRVPVGEHGRTVEASFLGESALFAQGPYVLAHLLGCPVYVFVCVREGGRHRLYLERFAERIVLPRQKREACIAQHAQRYAERLEHYCRKAPYQWFNFFDFWQRPTRPVSGQVSKQEGRMHD